MTRHAGRRVAAACLTLAAIASAAPTRVSTTNPSTTRSATVPATEPAMRPTAVVEPAARPLLDRVADYYAAARRLHVVGTLVGTFDVAGRRQTFTLDVDGRTDGHGRFVHAARGAGLLVSDGVDAYLYDEKRNAYATLTATPGRAAANDVDAAVVGVLLDEDPALLLTLTDDPAALLRRVATAIRLPSGATSGPATRPATAAAAAGLELDRDGKRLTLRIDPATGRLLGATVDFAPMLAARHTSGVEAARAVLTYASSSDEPPPADAFAWHPPVSATQFDLGENLLRPEASTRPTVRVAR